MAWLQSQKRLQDGVSATPHEMAWWFGNATVALNVTARRQNIVLGRVTRGGNGAVLAPDATAASMVRRRPNGR